MLGVLLNFPSQCPFSANNSVLGVHKSCVLGGGLSESIHLVFVILFRGPGPGGCCPESGPALRELTGWLSPRYDCSLLESHMLGTHTVRQGHQKRVGKALWEAECYHTWQTGFPNVRTRGPGSSRHHGGEGWGSTRTDQSV